ncbi:putative protein kinase RLK-Pelle-RLCK-Os family [Rosa chinensis]|uniref:Protein kinase domain-containing protein n=1 Tax=Rosa chinensis TaxID=74649 RepID=A0A2P6QT34_ROSCH|nr:putative protein kinase RLK-Pelle-RLCK-Os family [Rosa chinensis]
MAEVRTLGRIHHINLVGLYGFCFERHVRAIVYEYMSNGSLDKFLFHGNKILGFEKLHEIAVGTARGIAYLHEECQQRIVHYDIKPENILLDENFFPKVADFGLAKLFNRDKTHISMTGWRGTPGYAAPEVAICCVQYRPELRPLMSGVVKMLEGEIEIPRPSINPLQHSLPGTPVMVSYSTSVFDTDSSRTITGVERC